MSPGDGVDRLIAFDAGPANAPLNDFIKGLGLGDMDRDGRMALSGTVDEGVGAAAAASYLAPFPKSLDRFDFLSTMADGWNPRTARRRSPPHRRRRRQGAGPPAAPAGTIGRLRRRAAQSGDHGHAGDTGGVEAVPAEAVGWRGDAIEAECFAFLAVRVLRGLPISFPMTTGAPRPLTGGVLAA